jgi:hypothetical protein
MIHRSLRTIPSADLILLLVLALLITACNKTIISTTNPNGSMSVLGPILEIWEDPSSLGWTVKGSPTPDHLRVVKLEGKQVLKIKNGLKEYLVVKPSQASLLASPYMSWTWNMENPFDDQHPISLFVGFQNGNEQNQTWIPSFIRSDEVLPIHNRVLNFKWGKSALQRGTIISTDSINESILKASFIVRGGQENTNSWWSEAVDLYDIYHRAWPKDTIGQTQITFIGFGAAPSDKSIAGFISDIRISR